MHQILTKELIKEYHYLAEQDFSYVDLGGYIQEGQRLVYNPDDDDIFGRFCFNWSDIRANHALYHISIPKRTTTEVKGVKLRYRKATDREE